MFKKGMTLPPATQKPSTGHLKAINSRLKFPYAIILTIFVFIGLLLGSPVRGVVGFPDDFEDYDLGNLNPQDSWTGTALSNIQITDSTAFSGIQSVYILDSDEKYIEKSFTSTTTQGLVDFYVKVNSTTTQANRIDFYLTESGNVKIPVWVENTNVYYQDSTGYAKLLCSLGLNLWKKIEVEWQSGSSVRYRCIAPVWTDWIENTNSFNYIGGFRIHTSAYYGANPVFLDLVNTYGATGECGSNNCSFCNSSSTCSLVGCYWLNNYCYWFVPTTTSDFTSYYASNSSFATPTAFITGWVDFTKPFLETLGNWIGAFNERFNATTADLKGSELGSAIPEARGYIEVFDDFFGGLPVSELLITFLTILLLIVIFRIVRALVNFLKPI